MFSFQEQHWRCPGKGSCGTSQSASRIWKRLWRVGSCTIHHGVPFRNLSGNGVFWQMGESRLSFFSSLIYNLSSNWGTILLAGFLEGISLSRAAYWVSVTCIHLTYRVGSYALKKECVRSVAHPLDFQWQEILGQQCPYFIWSTNRDWAAGLGSFFTSWCPLPSTTAFTVGAGEGVVGSLVGAVCGIPKGCCEFGQLWGEINERVVSSNTTKSFM